jgi:hypothetical protein
MARCGSTYVEVEWDLAIAPWRVQYAEVLRKMLFKAAKSETFTGFCRILLIKKTNRRVPGAMGCAEICKRSNRAGVKASAQVFGQ